MNLIAKVLSLCASKSSILNNKIPLDKFVKSLIESISLKVKQDIFLSVGHTGLLE